MQIFLSLSNMSINKVSVFLVKNLWNFQWKIIFGITELLVCHPIKFYIDFNFPIYCPEERVYVHFSILWEVEKRGKRLWRKGTDKDPQEDVLTEFTGSFFLLLFSKGQLISAYFLLCSQQLPYAPDQDICNDNNWPLWLGLFFTC